jgi:hypothetical protein
MVSSTFISIGLHISFIIIAYFGMPILKVKEPIEQPIDIVDDTPISSQTSLKLGTTTVKKENEKKIEDKEKKIRKTVPPPPPVPSKKLVDKKNNELKKQKNLNEIAEIIKKKPKLKIEKKKEIPKVVSKPRILKQTTPKVVVKPEKIKNKQKENFAKGLLNTLAEAKIKNNEVKKEKANKEDLLNKIKKMAGNSNRQVKKTSLNFSQTG